MRILDRIESFSPLKRPAPRSIEIAPGIYAMRAFSATEAAALVQQTEGSAFWTPAHINTDHAVDRAVRDAELLPDKRHTMLAQSYRQRLEIIVGEFAYARAPGSSLLEAQLVRYAPGGKYVDHRDVPEEGIASRTLSLVCYLNDDFENGETSFTDAGVSVPPLAGIVIAFAPQLLHRAEPVANGRKYIITAWYHRV
jgi:predicted 2-oxoglutarate/Fe(II)-dependent dioxygenase YbiX